MLAIAGWDEKGHEAQLRNLVSELQLSPSVSFLGPQFGTNRDACLAQCDAFVLPSVSEGMPVAVLEGWAHGKPVLITPECNLQDGFSFGAAIRIETTVEGIASGLHDLMAASPSELKALGSRGYALVASRYTSPQVAAQFKAVYDWLLGGGEMPSSMVR